MNKTLTILTLAAVVAIPASAFANDAANKNGSQANPTSSAAVTPSSHKHSAGTVGAMKGAEGGSFTAKEGGKNAKLK